MNIPEIYLVEPYNAYAPKGKKKHWMQEVEEQNMMARIIAEQQQLQEAAAKRSSNTLPPQAPPTSQATSQNYSGGQGAAGNANTNGGGGQAPRPQFFHPSASYTFTRTPASSSAPTTVMVNIVGGEDIVALGGVQVGWNWGDGTIGYGAGAAHTYTGTGSFNIIMSVTSSVDGTNLGTQVSAVTMSVPTVAAAFTVTGSTTIISGGFYTASVGDTLTFINGASSNNPLNPLTYNWTFGSGSAPSSSLTNPTFTYTTASTYTVTLGVSGSFNAIATGTRNIKIV